MADLSEEAIKNLTTATENLNKTLEKTNAAYLEAGSKVNDIKDTTNEINKAVEKKTVKMFDGLNSTLDKMVESSESIVGMITGGTFIASLGTIAKHAWSMNDSMTAMAVRMGQGTKHAKVLEGSVSSMMKSFGAGYDDAIDVVSALAESKYADNLQAAAAGAEMFARATGVTNSSVTQLTDSLNKQAGMSAKSTNAVYAGMVKIQQTVGISKGGMEALTYSIHDMALNMASFGKSSDEIQRAAIKTTALAGAMEKVGISAQRTVALMDQLSDPDRIEDNILLYSQLGLSIEDALNGGVQEALSGDAFKEMAQRITDMGPIAGSAMAKSMGLSYKEVTRMAKMETGSMDSLIEDATTQEDEALDKLNEFAKNIEGIGGKIKHFFHQAEGWILGLGPILLTGLTLIAPKILALFRNIVAKLTGRENGGMQASVETGVSEGVKDGIQNGIKYSGIGGKLYDIRKFSEDFFKSGNQARQNVQNEKVSGLRENYADTKRKQEEIESKIREIKENARKNGGPTKNDSKNINFLESQREKAARELSKYVTLLAGENMTFEKYEGLNNKIKEREAAKLKAEEGLAEKNKRLSALREKLISATGEQEKEIKEAIKTLTENTQAEKSLEVANRLLENARQELAEAESGGAAGESKKRKTPASMLGQLIIGTTERAGAKLDSWKNNITENGKHSLGGAIAIKGAKGLAKGMAGLAKSFGPMAIVMAVIGKVLDKLKDPLMNLVDNLVKELSPLFEALMPIISNVLNTLAKALMPPILKVLSGLLSVLHYLLKPLQWILDGLSHIPGLGFLKDISKSLDEITGPKVTGALSQAANNIANSNKDLTKATEENTETTKEEIPTIKVEGGQAIMTGNSSQTVNSSVGSTTQSTQSVSTDEEKNKEANKEAREKNNSNELENQTDLLRETETHLRKIADLFSQLLGNLNTPSKIGEQFSLSGD